MLKISSIAQQLFKNNSTHYPKLYPNDVFLVSYPKSGNTWIRFILANLIKNSEDELIDFHTAINYIPEIGVHNEVITMLQSPRLLKSHHTYDEKYPKVIYIIRDPRDVYVSYYHYLAKSLPENTTFSDFIRMKNLHPCKWHEHVFSWLEKTNVALFLKYEDILENPYDEILKIVNLLNEVGGFNLQIDRIEHAIEKSSLSEMKRLEEKNGRPFKSEEAKQRASKFVRKGIKGDWKNHFSDLDQQYLIEEAGDLMKRFSYL